MILRKFVMDKFRSVPHEIDAFQFRKGWIRPDWFYQAVKTGGAQITWSAKEKHITIYTETQMERASINDWVCLSENKEIYVLGDEIFKQRYRKINDGLSMR